MSKKKVLYQTMLALSDTTLEGLEHISQRTMEGRFTETAELFTDVADSFHEMRTALQVCLSDLRESELEEQAGSVVEGMQMLLSAYEGDKDVRPMVVLQFALLPGFKKWRDTLHSRLSALSAAAMH